MNHSDMEYTVFYPNGQRQQFHLLCVAQLYQQVHGGVMVGPLHDSTDHHDWHWPHRDSES